MSTNTPTSPTATRQTWRIIDLIQWGQPHFESKNISNARLEVEWLLGHVVGLSRVQLYVEFERPLMANELAQFKAMVKRRTAGEPFQYIVGDAPFYGRDFKVTPAVLIPRPETEVMIKVLLDGPQPTSILDIGTGSGCLAITAALECPEAKVQAIDISTDALKVARENAAQLGVASVVFSEIDVLSNVPEGTFDVILCNPPYITEEERNDLSIEVKDHEPEVALFDGGDGLTFYRRLADLAPTLLSDEGRMIVEIGGDHQAEAVEHIFSEAGLTVSIHVDLQGDPRVVEGIRR